MDAMTSYYYRVPGTLQLLPANTSRYSYVEVIVASDLTSALCCDVCLDGRARRGLTDSVSTRQDSLALWEAP